MTIAGPPDELACLNETRSALSAQCWIVCRVVYQGKKMGLLDAPQAHSSNGSVSCSERWNW